MTRIEKWLQDNEDWRPYADLVVYPPLPEELMQEYNDVDPEVLARCGELVSEGGGHVSRGALYVRVRRENPKSRDRWAALLALQQPPGINTTDTFWAGRKPWYELYGDPNSVKNNTYVNDVKRELAKRGVNLKPTDEYMPELARFKGDPEAVIPFNGARSYIKNLCEKRGWACEGAVTTKHREPDHDPLADENCVPIAPDLIRRKAKDLVRSNPEYRKKSKAELRQLVLDKHSKGKNPAKV